MNFCRAKIAGSIGDTVSLKNRAGANSMKKIIKSLIPPIFWKGLQKLKKSAWDYVGDYPSWQEAEKNAVGYDAPEIIARVLAATEKVLAGEAVFERDSVLFYTPEYNWDLVLALYRIALDKGRLHLLDFGGALGSVYRQHARILKPAIPDISWNIVEQKSFSEAAAKLDHEKELHFRDTVEDALANCDTDVVLFSSVLQYIDNYEEIVEKVKSADYIIIDRHPEFCERENPAFTVQKVSEPIYSALYPLKIFGRGELEKAFLPEYTILEKWQYDSDIKQFFKSRDGMKYETHQIGMLLKKQSC